MTKTNAAALVGALATLAVMIELLRRRQLREKYAVLWLLVGFGVAVLAVFPGLLDFAGGKLGVADPPNLMLFVAALVLLLVCVHLSWEVSRLEDETRSLAEEIALLRMQVESQAHVAGWEKRAAAPSTVDGATDTVTGGLARSHDQRR